VCCNTSTLTVHWHVLQVRGKKFSFIVPLFNLPLSRATTLTLLTRSSCGFRSISLCLDSRESRRGARPSMLLKRGHGSPPVTEFASTMLNILYPQQTNRTLPAVLDSCTFYFCLALSIYKLSYFLLFVSLLNLFSSVLYFFIHLNILFFSLCISLSFTIYHGIRATAVSLFTQSGEQLDPHSAEPHGS
jgi:hypothetical protein